MVDKESPLPLSSGVNFVDLVIPAWSKDMNQVAALSSRSSKILTQGGHGLTKQDGELLLMILRNNSQA